MTEPLAVLFRIAGAVYAIPCVRISEVVPLVALHAVPQSPEWLLGAFIHRGSLIPVVDLCRLVAGYACPSRLSSRVVLVSCLPGEGRVLSVGLLAEQMTEARRLTTTQVESMPLTTSPYVRRVLLEGDTPLQMLDVDRLLTGPGSSVAEYFAHPRSASAIEVHGA